MIYFDYPVSVRYSDLAEDGALSETAILGMMQEAAARASDLCGFGPRNTRIYAWALCGWKFRIHKKIGWAETLNVRTWPRTMAHRTSDRDFIITDKNGDTVVSATSRWLLLDCATGKAAKITDEITSRYEFSDERALDEEIPANGRSPEGTPLAYAYTVVHRDIDTLHHMNNLHYLDLAREALPEAIRTQHFENIEIVYKRQIKLGDTVHFYYSCTEGKHLVEIMDGEDKKTHALLWFF